MGAAVALRSQIEASLARRIPAALTPQPQVIRPVVSTGIAAVDEAVGSGVPVGAVTEVMGTECSGRTSLALAAVAQVMREGKVCAWVDVSDALSPESAAAAGCDLGRLLWVRCGVAEEVQQRSWGGFTVPEKYFVAPPAKKGLHGGGFGMHPRDEEKGMGEAVGGLLGPRCAEAQRRVRMDRPGMGAGCGGRASGGSRELDKENVTSAAKAAFMSGDGCGTAEAVPLSKTVGQRGGLGEVVGSNGGVMTAAGGEKQKQGPRLKPDSLEEVCDRGLKPAATPFNDGGLRFAGRRKKHWDRMDQALRAMDLLMQAGGFGAIVLDLGSVAPEHVSRIPLATWFRYRAAAERTQTCVVLLTQYPCAKSSAELVLRMENGVIRTQGGRVMTGFERRVEVVRRRFEVHEEGEDAGGIGQNPKYRDPSPSHPSQQAGRGPRSAQDDNFNGRGGVVAMKKPPQGAGVGVWESRPTWAEHPRMGMR